MLALRLLSHSARQLFGNLKPALILSLIPGAIAMAGVLGLAVLSVEAERAGWSGALIAAVVVIVVLICAFAFSCLAVSWHRFVLLNEPPRLLNRPGRTELAYLFGMVRVGLIVLLVALPTAFLAMALISAVDGGARLIVSVIASLAMSLFLSVLSMRIGTGLPGIATGAERPLTTGWRSTRGMVPTLIAVALALLVIEAALKVVDHVPVIAALILILVLGWVAVMFSLSVLTTLWGHFVEARPLR